MSAPDPRNVRDDLLEAGYTAEQVDDMLRAPLLRSLLARAVDYLQGDDCRWCGAKADAANGLECSECAWWHAANRIFNPPQAHDL